VYDIIGRRKTFYLISAVFILIGLVSLAVRGLNLGIDFTSGTLIQMEFERAVEISAIEEVLGSQEAAELGISKFSVRLDGSRRVAMVRVNPISAAAQNSMMSLLNEKVGAVTELSTDQVDPLVGRELVRKAVIALALASVGILVYVSLRFEPRFAAAGVAALIHDVLVVLSLFSILQVEINSPFIAAILTVVGYSINATIIIFDRIRENLARIKGEGIPQLANTSINQTLIRCLYTSLTTLFAALSLHIFGAASIRDLTLAFLVGIIAGTYSSICIAGSIWVDWKEWDRRRALMVR
jgi:preprotein translocase subunit SecF